MSEHDTHVTIREAENTFRDFISSVLADKLGSGWLEQSGLSPERIDKIRGRQSEEQRRRPLQKADDRPLYFADLTDLGIIKYVGGCIRCSPLAVEKIGT